ncbi:MAG TPA: hypothetical protein VJ123_10780 [Anaerolineales bacterium]|nr:hypothetical protein [Anaerolineales bacterium]
MGKSIEERAVHYLQQELPYQTQILAPFALPAIASRMTYVDMESVPSEIASAKGLWEWLDQVDIRAIYVDRRYEVKSDVSPLVEGGLGQYFDVGFTADESTLRVYIPRPK